MTSASSPHELPFCRLRHFSVKLAPPEKQMRKKGSQHRKPHNYCWPHSAIRNFLLTIKAGPESLKMFITFMSFYITLILVRKALDCDKMSKCSKLKWLQASLQKFSQWDHIKAEQIENRRPSSDLHSSLDSGHFTYPLFTSTSSFAKWVSWMQTYFVVLKLN